MLPLLDISEKVIEVAGDLIASSIIPQRFADDAYHIACAAVHRMDYLLTWNFAHIANPHNWGRIRQQLSGIGLEMPAICTPEGLIGDDGYEDNN